MIKCARVTPDSRQSGNIRLRLPASGLANLSTARLVILAGEES